MIPDKKQNIQQSNSLGKKLTAVAGAIGTIKQAYDIGKTIYSGIQTARPIIQAVAGMI